MNRVGRAILSSGASGGMGVPLDVESLLAEARSNTGLTDFGREDVWREGLEVLARGLDRESRLTLLGRVLSRGDIVNALETRLKIEETYREFPGIHDESMNGPIFIVGLPLIISTPISFCDPPRYALNERRRRQSSS